MSGSQNSQERTTPLRITPYGKVAAQARAYAAEHGTAPSAQDAYRTGLLLIDCQLTFCHPDFELFVAGADEDMRRTAEFIYNNIEQLTTVFATLDTHTAVQIFFDSFFINDQGQHPTPLTTDMSLDALERGEWRADPAAAVLLGMTAAQLQAHILHYVRELAAAGKYTHTIWPYHAMLGGVGHALAPAIEEACFFHAQARCSQTVFEMKGANPLTENYSALRPEVVTTSGGRVIAAPNSTLIETLLQYDRLIVAGEAKSHCVAWTVEDLLAEINRRDPALTSRVYLLEDCTSPVVVPGAVDFTDAADEAYARFGAAGMHIVNSTTPIGEWPSCR